MAINDLLTVTPVIGGAVALLTLAKAVREFTVQNADKRTKQFLELRKWYRENLEFQRITQLIARNDPELATMELHVRFEFMGFLEDIAFLVNSGVLREEVAYYVFGADLMAAWGNDIFWGDELRGDRYWTLLRDFTLRMTELDKRFIYNRKKMTL
ncbi:MAG TPA: hypothetical protein VGL56_09410 [Fimbriimonadaceae bacterium]|jgi:hypothetical protein